MQQGIDLMEPNDGIISIHAMAAPEFWRDATLSERARRMKAIAELAERNKAKLNAAFSYELQVPTHPLARIALRVLTSLASVPYPSSVQADLAGAFAHLEKAAIAPSEQIRKWRTQIDPIIAQFAPEFSTQLPRTEE